MRLKKRLRWSRTDVPASGTLPETVVYIAKRRTETFVITPQNGGRGGPYTVIYASKHCKRKAIVSNLVEAKEAAEVLRESAKPNPISKTTKQFLVLGGVAGATVAATVWWMNRKASAPVALPQSNPTHVTLQTGTTTWMGGTLFVDLPVDATGWVSVNGHSQTGNQPLQLPDNPIGTYNFDYTAADGTTQSATLTVAAQGA